MFHLLFVPRYLDYVQTDLGGLLRPVTQLSERTFSLRRLSLSPPLSVAIKRRAPVLFFPRHSHPTSPILRHPITSPKSLFSLSFSSIHPSIHPPIRPSLPALHRSPSLGFTLLCSALTLSGLPHVSLQAYSVPDAEFYCHSLCTGTLGVRSVGDFFHYTGFCGYSF